MRGWTEGWGGWRAEGGGGVADDVAVIIRSHHSGQQEAWR